MRLDYIYAQCKFLQFITDIAIFLASPNSLLQEKLSNVVFILTIVCDFKILNYIIIDT